MAATNSTGAQLPVSEADYFICHSLTLEYRRACLKYWREVWGDSYAIAVEKEVRKQWGKRAGRAR